VSAHARYWLVLIAALLGIAVTVSLGRWQLSRAGQKEAMLAAIQAESLKPPIGNAALLQAVPGRANGADGPEVRQSPYLHRMARLRGEWAAPRTVYLDNRQMNGRPGFYVVTPLQLEGTQQAIAVQRGWIPRNFGNRSAIAAVPVAGGLVEVQGRIALPPSKLLDLGGPQTGRIRQNLDMSAYALETGLQLLPLSLVQTAAAPDGLLREWPTPDFGAAKNYGYAAQWFALAALIAALYAWFQIYKRHVRQPA
jgi:surfeit locus 1 family protein